MNQDKITHQNQKLAMRVSVNTIIGNAVLSAFKLAAGLVGKSGAMLSDAVHSLSDVISTVIVMIGVKMAGKDSDERHPYGHERFECVAALLLAVILAATGIGIGYGGVRTILAREEATLAIPGIIALVAAIVSIAAKEAMYWYTRSAAKKTNSGALMADAWHHRSDALSSIGSLVGIAGARLGLPILDPIASIVICLFILKAAVDIFLDAVRKMTDEACDATTEKQITSLAKAQDGVLSVDRLKTRLFGSRIYVDVEISADGEASLTRAHDIAQRVHDVIEREIPGIKHCMVHVNPSDEER